MPHEDIPRDALCGAQDFFWEFCRKMRSGPLEDGLETAVETLALNERIDQLTQGGRPQPNGSVEAQYEALDELGKILAVNAALKVGMKAYRTQTCTLNYAAEGFTEGHSDELLLWTAKFEMENVPHTALFSTPGGHIGHMDEQGGLEFEAEYTRGLVLAANVFSGLFNPDIFIQRIY